MRELNNFYESNFHVVDNAMRDFEKARRAYAAKVEKNPDINDSVTFKVRSCYAKS